MNIEESNEIVKDVIFKNMTDKNKTVKNGAVNYSFVEYYYNRLICPIANKNNGRNCFHNAWSSKT